MPPGSTPHIDFWRATARRHLSPRGRKAELARHLAEQYGGQPRTWEKNIAVALKSQMPSGELVLAISAWLEANPDHADDSRPEIHPYS